MFRFKMLSTIFLLSSISIASTAQTISTVAGGGTVQLANGYSATLASLNAPMAIAVDPTTGNIFFADNGSNGGAVVYKIAAGTISLVAGTGARGYSGDGGLATNATFGQFIGGLAIAPSGNIYISDTYNAVVRKITVSTGIITAYAGGTAKNYGQNEPAISSPVGLAVNSSTLYIADSHRIRKVSSSGLITTAAGNGTTAFAGDGGAATSASFTHPWALALDSTSSALYISDIGLNGANCRVRKVVLATGIISTFAGDAYCGYLGDGGAAVSAELSLPKGLAVASNGDVYIADSGNSVVRRVSAGTIYNFAGNGAEGFSGDGGTPTTAQLRTAHGIALSGSTYYIADTSNQRIRKIQ